MAPDDPSRLSSETLRLKNTAAHSLVQSTENANATATKNTTATKNKATSNTTATQPPATWQMVQISDVLDKELGSALAEDVPLLAWQPQMTFRPWAHREQEQPAGEPPLRIRSFPLLRGYWRFPLSTLADFAPTLVRRMKQHTEVPEETPLICTTPYYAPLAERWAGPVIYWLTDLMAAYAGVNPALVRRLDARMCKAATLVCPNSSRVAAYLTDEAGCDPGKIAILPNATRRSNLLPAPPLEAGELPAEISDARRPLAGIIGNLAGNMDWLLLRKLVEITPEFTWVFVGPVTMEIEDAAQRDARHAVTQHPNARFVGRKAYGELASFARCFDVAVLPYLRREPTFSGSSTRFYEHLAACRPMIATRGFEELLHKEPLLRLVDTAEEAAAALHELKDAAFDDGCATARWQASRQGTWTCRAETMQQALAERR